MRFHLVFVGMLMLTGCMDFNMSEEAFKATFAEADVVPKSASINLDGTNIHYVYTDQGKDKLLVFVHGSPGSWTAFIDFFKNDTLLQQFDMLSIDRPGFGQSDFGRPVTAMKQQAYLMKRVIERFDHQNKILIGHSLGGPVIARIAMDYPSLAQGLVMVAPSIDPEMEKNEWYRSFIKTKLIGALTPTAFWVSNEEIVPLEDELTDMLPLWEQIVAPTIVIQGTKDMLVPKENAAFAQEMMADSLITVKYLKGVNHFIPWSNPDEIVKAVLLLTI